MLSKIFTALIRPLFWIVVLGIASLISKNAKRKKRYAIILVCLAFFCSNKVIVNELSILYESDAVVLGIHSPRTAVVLGGFAEYDGSRKRVQMAMAAERLFEAFRLYKNHSIDTIILSGGAASLTSNQKPESIYIRKYLIDLGVDSSKILMDTGSKNTFENAILTKKVLQNHNHKETVLLITSAMHMPRAKRVFEKAGIAVMPYPVNFLSDRGRGYVVGDYLMPSSEALYHFDALMKEWVGLVVYKLTGKA